MPHLANQAQALQCRRWRLDRLRMAVGKPGKTVTQAAAYAVVRIFLPLVRLLLRHGIPYKTVAEWLRWCYAKVAYEEHAMPGRKPSKSRVAIITGLTRVDVDRLLKMPSPADSDDYEEYQRAAKVLTGWARDKRYAGGSGPIDLPFEGKGQSFSELVDKFSGGTPPRAVLDELLRVKAVEQTEQGNFRLLSPRYVPIPEEGREDYLDILGHSVSTLIDTIDFNTRPGTEVTRLQGLAFNSQIPESVVDELAAQIKDRGREFVFSIDSLLYEHAEPEGEKSDQQLSEAGIGIYFFKKEPADADDK